MIPLRARHATAAEPTWWGATAPYLKRAARSQANAQNPLSLMQSLCKLLEGLFMYAKLLRVEFWFAGEACVDMLRAVAK